MNKKKLKDAEKLFLKKHPLGFESPDLQALGKKHKMTQMIEMAQENFKKKNFSDSSIIAEYMVKMVSRSSMVSMFEKPKFRDTVYQASDEEREQLSKGLKSFLHGSQKRGFETLIDVLLPYKLAKWSLVTVIPNYYKPDDEVFIKPTTAKGVIEYFELKNLTYKPQPTWEFYENYRDVILSMREQVDDSVAPNNAAFCGFLMMSMN